MNEHTRYYTLSTIPQILAATSAVLGAFIHFRLITIHNILIWDGEAILKRVKLKEKGYNLDKIQKGRLRDAIYRRSISEIKEILGKLKNKEIDAKYTKATRPTGLIYLFEDRFCPAEKQYSDLKKYSMRIIWFCLTTIIIAVISLSLIDHLNTNILKNIFLYTNVGLFILSIILSFILVRYSNINNTTQENTKKRDKIIKKNKNISHS